MGLGKTNLSFGYDATGNRLYKHLENEAQERTWYIRDPSGNTLMVYKTTDKENSLGQYREITQSEAHLYGSKRLGIQKIDQLIGKMPIGQQTEPQEEGAKAVENLRISELLYDSPMTPNNGTTETHLGEFVALYNIGIEPINLEDITLTSADNGTVDFGQGTQIQSGQTVIVAYGTPSDKDDFLKVNDLWEK